jgi:hypothetical protein
VLDDLMGVLTQIDNMAAGLVSPPQPEERNFCPRCGKRTADLTTIHTCTPPQTIADEHIAKVTSDIDLAVNKALAQPERPWVGLTEEEIHASKPPISNDAVVWELAVEWAEAKLKEKNT